MTRSGPHVVVVGGGNAGLCAAIAAAEAGARVTLLERAPKELAGGNSAFTGGIMRFAFEGVDAIRKLVPELTDAEMAAVDLPFYREANFMDDLGRVTEYRCDPDLAEVLVAQSYSTIAWMQRHGVRFAPSYNRQAYRIDGRYRFWGGLVLEVVGGGPGLVTSLTAAAERQGVELLYRARATELLVDDDGVKGVRARIGGRGETVQADAVVLAAGGFQADAEWRTRCLGPGWDLAKVRGTRYDTGDGIRMALEAGASPAGNWSGCHAVAWDMNAPEFGDLHVGDGYQKHSYPLGIVVNVNGHRFLDEGADFRNYTYAKYGRLILEQPYQVAWQIFDGKVAHLLRDEYRIRGVTKVTADTVEELAHRLSRADNGVDEGAFLATINSFNASVRTDMPFDPNVLDGRSTMGIHPPKSNWSNTIDVPPYLAFGVTCGITFTFGGVRINPSAQVMDPEGQPISNLYACGEMAGGVFYFNYPGGAGLTAGSVFGKIAGGHAGSGLPVAERRAGPGSPAKERAEQATGLGTAG